MKFKLILLLLIAFSIHASSQTKNDISVLYGFSTTSVDIHNVIGDYGYNDNTGYLFGVRYTRTINKFLSIETGLQYQDDKVRLDVIEGGLGEVYSNGEVKTLSVPLMAKFTFFKYFFADGGLLLDKQTNYTNDDVINNQSGLGGELGVGAKFTLSHVTLFVNPYLRQYNVTSSRNNLYESGFKFGLGFGF
jgi:Outer membrane protein beta-barrel domain